MSQQLPPSTADWNNLFNLAASIALIAVAIVIGVMLFFAVKYHEKKGQPKFISEIVSKNRARDAVVFASISIIILSGLTIASYRLTVNERFPPSFSDSLIIDVEASQWHFNFTYTNGVTTVGEAFVPADKNIIFNVTSSDVMHNFGLMDFREKVDAIPGRYNIMGITTPPLSGNGNITYTIRCYELCGVGHTFMTQKLTVINSAVFDNWLNNQTGANATRVGG
jgi:cytochrome c oxidase subunit II